MAAADHALHYLEIVTPQVDAACQLYAALHGWRFGPAVPELGQARVADLPDGSRCGIRAPMHPEEHPVQRTYRRVPDLAAATRAAAEQGAAILLEAMPLPGLGTITIFEHGGVQQGLWQLP